MERGTGYQKYQAEPDLDHVRCNCPHMVRIEFRTTLLAYNLIRSVSAIVAGVCNLT